MADSKVYWMDAHSESTETSLVAKMTTVFNAAKLDEMISPNDVVAIKIHCGEWNNSAYLRPVYARALADRIKELGGRPFVCDTTTSTYSPYGSRSSQLDILLTAERNGYSSATLGCPFVCADGWLGTADFRVDIPEGYLLKRGICGRGDSGSRRSYRAHPLQGPLYGRHRRRAEEPGHRRPVQAR